MAASPQAVPARAAVPPRAPARDVVIAGTGFYMPERVLGNAELEQVCGRSDEWIVERTGVRERRIAAAGQTTSELARRAVLQACQRSGISADDLDLIVVATVTGETHFPATACWLQAKLGNTRAMPLDINMGCAGFIYALAITRSLLLQGPAELAVVVGADRVTGITNYTDPRSCILFGDGAGAVLLRSEAAGGLARGVLNTSFFSDSTLASLISRPLDAHATPDRPVPASSGGAFMFMDGPEVYKRAVRSMAEAVQAAVAEAHLTLANVDWVVPHQANARIIESIAERLGLPREKVYVNIDRYGNTSAATIPVCLAEMDSRGLLHEGDRVVLCTFGTGLVWAATLLVWTGDGGGEA